MTPAELLILLRCSFSSHRHFYWEFLKGNAIAFGLVIFLAVFQAPGWVMAATWLASSYFRGVFRNGKVVLRHLLGCLLLVLIWFSDTAIFKKAVSVVVLIVVVTIVKVSIIQVRGAIARDGRAIKDPVKREKVGKVLRMSLPYTGDERVNELLDGYEPTAYEEQQVDAFILREKAKASARAQVGDQMRQPTSASTAR